MSDRQSTRSVRIGGASGYWGDTPDAPRQLVMQGDIDYLVFDYLAEVTMSILVRAKAKDPQAGYAGDFVELAMKPLLHEIKTRGIRVVTNAGGVNVRACAAALAKVAEEAGISLKIGTVEGDDLLDQIDDLRRADVREMFTGAALPRKLISANAYLGAFPIAAALSAGAEVVITGRCVDSAVTLGPLIHEFGWGPDDFDQLAAGTLAGHIIECGAQATGGNFTDWREVMAGWDNMGFPIAECRPDGSFCITKPDSTGGLVSPLTVAEQLLYEIGDPSAYIMPDVVADFSAVRLEQTAAHRVEVSGAKGRAPTSTYKVSATYADGFRLSVSTGIVGFDAADKARAYMDALLARSSRMLLEKGLGDFGEVATYVYGAEASFGGNALPWAALAREVQARIEVRHASREALELFSKEVTGSGLSMTPGRITAGAAGRPKVTPVVAQFALLVDKASVRTQVQVDGFDLPFTEKPLPTSGDQCIPHPVREPAQPAGAAPDEVELPLIALAVARGGDKGNNANVALIARAPELTALIARQVTAERVGGWFAHVLPNSVERFFVPGLEAFNFVLTNCLGGGGTSSLRLDNQAKTYAQQLLAMPVRVSADLARRYGGAFATGTGAAQPPSRVQHKEDGS